MKDSDETSAESARVDALTREELLRRGGAAAVAIGLGGTFAAQASGSTRKIEGTGRMSEVARAVLAHPRVIHIKDAKQNALVLALKDELLVLRAPQVNYGPLHNDLQKVARLSTTLKAGHLAHFGKPTGLPAGYNVELWRITNPAKHDAFKLSRKLRRIVKIRFPGSSIPVRVPTVSPNHISVVSGYDMCPDGPPRLPSDVFPDVVFPPIPNYTTTRGHISIAVLDTGFIPFERMGNMVLSQRRGVISERAWWPDTSAAGSGPPTAVTAWNAWQESGDDDLATYPDIRLGGKHRLPGVAGHGSFVTGILAAGCPNAEITVVGHRHEVIRLPTPGSAPNDIDKMKLFTAELAIARSIVKHRDKQMICCGFAFPTLDGLGSIPFLMYLPYVSARTLMLAPAGNEDSRTPYWPAAHARVIGVGATDIEATAKANFSNYGASIDCCSPGVNVLSTFGYVTAIPQEVAAVTNTDPWRFKGWAVWNGTCFATPTVAARIASEAVQQNISPKDAWEDLKTRATKVDFFGTPQNPNHCPFISLVDPS